MTRKGRAGALILPILLLAATITAPAVAAFAADRQAAKIYPEWIRGAKDPAKLMTLLTSQQPAKVSSEFFDRLQYAFKDGSLRVMVTLKDRSPTTAKFVTDHSKWLSWYGASAPRYMARVTPDQLSALLSFDRLLFLEPDYPLDYFLSDSTLDVHARSATTTATDGSIDGDESGLWWYEKRPSGDKFGRLHSDVDGLTADQVTGKGVVVQVTDSGLDKTHKDFGGFACDPARPYTLCESRVLRTVVMDHLITDTGLEPGESFPTTDLASGHGTHVAGTIAGNGYYSRTADQDKAFYGGDGFVIGLAPQASLVSVKSGDSQSAAFATAALQWTLDHAKELGIRVSSNSWGCIGGCAFDPNSATAQVQKDLYNAGVLLLFAAGNDAGEGSGAEFAGGSQSPYVLSVAAYDDSNDRLTDFSSRGVSGTALTEPNLWTPEGEEQNGMRRPDIAAPGENIFAARTLTAGTSSGPPRVWTGDVTGARGSGYRPYVSMSGTSMATPHVAGAAAQLIGACPSSTPLDLMRALIGAADKRIMKTDGSALAQPFETGYGALDVRGSLEWLQARPVCGNLGGNVAPIAVASGPEVADAGDVVTFDGTKSVDPDGSIVGYSWQLGDGVTKSGPVVTTTYTSPGPYAVTLTVTDNDGAKDTDSLSISVARPSAVRIVSPAEGATVPSRRFTVTGTVGLGELSSRNGGGTLYMVGDGSVGVSLVSPSSFQLSSRGNGNRFTRFTTAGPWDTDADENEALVRGKSAEPVYLSGEPVRFIAHVEYTNPLNADPIRSQIVCPVVAQIFSADGTVIGQTEAQAFPHFRLGTAEEIAFTFLPKPGEYAGLKVQFGTVGVDCGTTPASWVWGTDLYNTRLELGPKDVLLDGPLGLGREVVKVYVDDAETPAAFTFVDTNNVNQAGTWSVVMKLQELEAGVHRLRAEWVEADGTVVSETIRTFKLS